MRVWLEGKLSELWTNLLCLFLCLIAPNNSNNQIYVFPTKIKLLLYAHFCFEIVQMCKLLESHGKAATVLLPLVCSIFYVFHSFIKLYRIYIYIIFFIILFRLTWKILCYGKNIFAPATTTLAPKAARTRKCLLKSWLALVSSCRSGWLAGEETSKHI